MQYFSFCFVDGVNAATVLNPESEEAVEVCKDEGRRLPNNPEIENAYHMAIWIEFVWKTNKQINAVISVDTTL